MPQKFASIDQTKKYSCNKSNKKININSINTKKVSPDNFLNLQSKYDTMSVVYANEIENVANLFCKNNSFYFFAKENFSEIFEDFKEKFKKFNLSINFSQVKNLDEIITNISNFNCGLVFFDILNDKNDVTFMSKFLESQNIPAINFSNCSTVLSSKMSINVDFKKNILKSFSSQEKLKIFFDCVYFNLQTKRALNLKLKT